APHPHPPPARAGGPRVGRPPARHPPRHPRRPRLAGAGPPRPRGSRHARAGPRVDGDPARAARHHRRRARRGVRVDPRRRRRGRGAHPPRGRHGGDRRAAGNHRRRPAARARAVPRPRHPARGGDRGLRLGHRIRRPAERHRRRRRRRLRPGCGARRPARTERVDPRPHRAPRRRGAGVESPRRRHLRLPRRAAGELTMDQHTPQKLDPLAGVTGQMFVWGISVTSIVIAASLTSIHFAEYNDHRMLVLALVAVAGACVVTVLASAPHRSPFTRADTVLVHMLCLIAVVCEAAAQWGTDATVRSDWGPIAYALLVAVTGCYRPARWVVISSTAGAAVVAAVTIAGQLAYGSGLPPVVY